MREIAEMTERIVKKAKEYDRDTMPGDYATLTTPCPNCGGVVQGELPPLRLHRQAGRRRSGCGFSFSKIPGGRAVRARRGRAASCATSSIGPLRGLPLEGGLAVHRRDSRSRYDEEIKNWKLEFDFGEDARTTARPASWSTSPARSRSAPARSAAAASTSSAATTSASTRSDAGSRRRPATSRAARSSCSSRWRASRWPSCWRPARPTCWTGSSRAARGARSRPSSPGTRRRARSSFEFEPRAAKAAARRRRGGRGDRDGRRRRHAADGTLRGRIPFARKPRRCENGGGEGRRCDEDGRRREEGGTAQGAGQEGARRQGRSPEGCSDRGHADATGAAKRIDLGHQDRGCRKPRRSRGGEEGRKPDAVPASRRRPLPGGAPR